LESQRSTRPGGGRNRPTELIAPGAARVGGQDGTGPAGHPHQCGAFGQRGALWVPHHTRCTARMRLEGVGRPAGLPAGVGGVGWALKVVFVSDRVQG
jgi:hypothetical protein